MYLFITMIMLPQFQLFIPSGLAKGGFPAYQQRNVDWKWTSKNYN